MIALEPGRILEREYKGNPVKVKVLKDGSYSYNGKTYEDRGSLMKAITKGKVAQFTTFFNLTKSREEDTNGAEAPKKVKKSTSAEPTVAKTEQGTIEGIIRTIVREEIKTFFQNADI